MDDVEKRDSAEAIKDIIIPILSSFGIELVDLEYKKSGHKWFLRVFIDKKDGVALDDCEKVSTHISQVLDVEDIIPHTYILEVSSPGLDRPLKKTEDYQREKGKLVRINTFGSINNQKIFIGRILDIESGNVKIEEDKLGKMEIPLSNIAKARLEIEFK
ncbi:MAG: ribosome maturation factor RimP [Nitrospirae bacterium]|nr:ribosome maturation factor RimP [Nitrospirota bacterium]